MSLLVHDMSVTFEANYMLSINIVLLNVDQINAKQENRVNFDFLLT